MKCIYCLEEKTKSAFKKREHIIPQCFGKFDSNLVLKQVVCDQCNQFFGDKIELFWGRDSFESIERLRHGINSKASLNKKIRIKSKICAGSLQGVIVEPIATGNSGRILVEKQMQVGFYNRKKKEYDFFKIDQIPSKEELENEGYQIREKQVRLIAKDDELSILVDMLQQKGITFRKNYEKIIEPVDSEEVQINTELILDKVIMRGICKIAFNYLAYVAGKEFCYLECFDGIRNFIRYNMGEFKNFIAFNQPPILYEDQFFEKYGMRVTEGHLININLQDKSIISQISLFNMNTFGVLICDSYNGLWIPIKSGHHFDVINKKVKKLFSVSKKLITIQ
jgi:hypothetical protein